MILLHENSPVCDPQSSTVRLKNEQVCDFGHYSLKLRPTITDWHTNYCTIYAAESIFYLKLQSNKQMCGIALIQALKPLAGLYKRMHSPDESRQHRLLYICSQRCTFRTKSFKIGEHFQFYNLKKGLTMIAIVACWLIFCKRCDYL